MGKRLIKKNVYDPNKYKGQLIVGMGGDLYVITRGKRSKSKSKSKSKKKSSGKKSSKKKGGRKK